MNTSNEEENHDKYGYGIFDVDGVLEIQRIDESEKFKNDAEAVEQFKQDLIRQDEYAMDCVLELIEDYNKHKHREGRCSHDMDFFEIWDVLNG